LLTLIEGDLVRISSAEWGEGSKNTTTRHGEKEYFNGSAKRKPLLFPRRSTPQARQPKGKKESQPSKRRISFFYRYPQDGRFSSREEGRAPLGPGVTNNETSPTLISEGGLKIRGVSLSDKPSPSNFRERGRSGKFFSCPEGGEKSPSF